MKMTGEFIKRTIIAIAVASLGVAALAGCTSGTPTPQRTALTTKAAAAYYLATTCEVNAAEDTFNAALNAAEQSTSQTGPALDNLKAAALAYEKADRAAADRLGNPKVVWPASVRKSITVMHDASADELPSLKAMATATRMQDEATALSDFPKSTKAGAAVQNIRSRLGASSTASNTCAASGSTPSATPVAPATGILIKGAGGGYTFHVPVGWTVPKDAPKADAFAISAKADADGVFDTVNVLPAPATTDSLDQVEQNGVSYLEEVMKATHVTVRPRVVVAGVESVHISSLRTQGSISEWDEQYSIERSGIAYTVTFAFNSSEPQAEREALAESVLASWTWS
jgi:hypothetical protein